MADYGLKVEWVQGTKYYDTNAATIGGQKYEQRIIGIEGFSKRLTQIKEDFNTPTLEIILNDKDGAIKSYIADEIDCQRNTGIASELKYDDGTTLINLRLTDIDFNELTVTLKLSQKIDILENNLLDIISDQDFPNAVSDAYGKPIPYILGTITAGGNDGTYSAWKISATHYLAANSHLTSIDRVMEGGVNIVGGWSLLNHTDGRAYLAYAGTEDTVELNVTRTPSPNTLAGFINTIFSDLFGAYAYTSTGAFINRLVDILYIPSMAYLNFILTEQLTGEDLLKLFSQAFCCDWYLDNDGVIGISYIDMKSSAGNEQGSYTQDDMSEGYIFKEEILLNEIKNKIEFSFKYLPIESNYKFCLLFHKTESQDNAGIFDDEIENCFTDYDAVAFGSAKYYANMHQYPVYEVINVCFIGKIHIDKFIGYNVGDILKITHPNALTATARYYRIIEMRFDLDHDSVYVDLRDINFLESIESHVLLIQPGYSQVIAASPYFYDYSPYPSHGVQGVGSMVHATDQFRFGSASGYLEDIQAWVAGSKTPSLFELQGNTYDFIMGAWYYFVDASPAAIAVIMDLYEDIDNRITIRLQVDGTLGFVVREAGINEVSIEPLDVIADATWYFIMWAKIGTDWGMYLGAKDSGTISQIGYGSYAAGNYLTAPVANFGRRGDGDQFVQNGRIDQAFIIRKNIFNLAPVVGVTDSFTEPTTPFTDRFLRGY